MAEIQTILANGKRLMSEAGCRKALESQIQGQDLILAYAPNKMSGTLGDLRAFGPAMAMWEVTGAL
jgi:hypothetical protein